MEIENNLKTLIKESKYNRKYILEQLDITRNTLTHWISGKHYPSIPQLLVLAKLLEVEINEIYKLKEENNEL